MGSQFLLDHVREQLGKLSSLRFVIDCKSWSKSPLMASSGAAGSTDGAGDAAGRAARLVHRLLLAIAT